MRNCPYCNQNKLTSVKAIWEQNSIHTTTSMLGGGIAFGNGAFPIVLGGMSNSVSQTPLVAECSPPTRTHNYSYLILIILSLFLAYGFLYTISLMPIYSGIITGIAGVTIGVLILFSATDEFATTLKNADRYYFNQLNKWKNTYYCFNCGRFYTDLNNVIITDYAPCINVTARLSKLLVRISIILICWYVLMVTVSFVVSNMPKHPQTTIHSDIKPIVPETSDIKPVFATDPHMHTWHDVNSQPVARGNVLRKKGEYIVIFNGIEERLLPINKLREIDVKYADAVLQLHEEH
ncbi:MAG: hypothetical protein WDA42_08585 [Candidatus Bathyarchaeia archaeon]